MPIAVPPGTAGMVPALTLDYNSQESNGVAGVGWSLGGLPAIGRCPQTIVQDGAIGDISFDADDRFCLDGQRLVAVSGTYGADGSEYRTELDIFSRIRAHGVAGGGPAWFEVETKTGQVMEFGHTADSQVLVQGSATVRLWAVSKVADTKGNYFSVSYTNDAANGQAYPARIDYTGNAAAGLTPYNSVQFSYATRPDVSPQYHSGVLISVTQRLTGIKTYAGPTLVSDYRVSYEQSAATGRSRISKIELCDGSGACLPATTFAWQEGGTFGFNPVGGGVSPSEIDGGKFRFFGDWNSDGLTDALWYRQDLGRNNWYVNNGTSNGTLSFTRYDSPIPPSEIHDGTTIYFGDWDGDGRLDVMWYAKGAGTNRWYRNNGIANSSLSFTKTENAISYTEIHDGTGIFFGDWNGDGRTDVMWYANGSGTNRWYVNNGSGTALSFTRVENPITPAEIDNSGILIFGDWNGDGRTDVLWYDRSTGANAWYINNGFTNGSLTFTKFVDPILRAEIKGGDTFQPGDWNADGLTDFLWYNNGGGQNRWYINNGPGNASLSFTKHDNAIPAVDIDNGGVFYIGDWNGDGRSDGMWYKESTGGNLWFINNGIVVGALNFTKYSNPINPTQLSVAKETYFGDWNGDGIDEFMYVNPPYGWNGWFVNTNVKPDLLASIANGIGASTTITHRPMTDAGVYTRDSGANAAVYPVVDVAAGAYLVKQVDSSNGIGGVVSTRYAYAGAKTDRWGRGFLGFRQVAATDLQSSIVDTTTYRQDFPFVGLVAAQTRTLGAQTLSATTNTYDFRNAAGAAALGTPSVTAAPYRAMLSASQVAGFDLDGTALPQVTSATQYDAFLNATQITVTASDGHSKTTTNTYSNDTVNWRLGRLTGATVTSTAPSP